MQTSRFALILGLAIAGLVAYSPSAAFAQGSLLPPGPPGVTMKTLDQVEARIPLVAGSPGVSVNTTSGTITISQPGSYYLTGNLLILPGGSGDGILIASDNVTIDLNGFTINSTVTPAAGSGIGYSGVPSSDGYIFVNNISIRNGFIRSSTASVLEGGSYVLQPGAGFVTGIGTTNLYMVSSSIDIDNITVSGINGDGIYPSFYSSSTVRNSHASGGYGSGIVATLIENCTASSRLGAISGRVVRSSEGTSSLGVGVEALIATECIGYSYAEGSYGLFARTATNCRGKAYRAGGVGIGAVNATNCSGEAEGGVKTIAPNEVYSGNLVPVGVWASGTAQNCEGAAGFGVAIRAKIGVACTLTQPGYSFFHGGTLEIENRYNMPATP
jgi:hypothetical protein